MALFISLAWPGMRFGLPDNTHLFSYHADEGMWIIGLNNMMLSKERFPNPKLIQPTLYLWSYAMSLRIAEHLDYLNPVHSPKDVIPTRFTYARVHLAGRYLVLGYALLAFVVTWAIAFRCYGRTVALISTSLMAITPGFIALTHYSYTNIPAMAMAMLSIACLLQYLVVPKASRRWYFAAAFFAGLACATKYSAFALAIPMLYAWWTRERELKTLIQGAGLALLAFVLGCPFLMLTPSQFFQGFAVLSAWLKIPIPGLLNKIVFPFKYPYPYLMGMAFFWVSVVACLWAASRKDRGSVLLLLWLAALLAGAYRCGAIATPGRLLVALPALAILTARMIEFFTQTAGKHRALAWTLTACLYGSTLLPALAVVHLHNTPPPQKVASQRMWEHIPQGTPIGGVEHAFHWTPDIMYPTAPDLVNYKPYFPLIDLKGSIEAAKKVPYILAAEHQRWRVDPEFFKWLESGKDFVLQETFRRDLRFGQYRWHRPESPFGMSEDDLSVNTLYIYRNRHFSKTRKSQR